MGIEIGIEWLTLIMFGSLLALLMAGLPLAFVTGGWPVCSCLCWAMRGR